MYSQNNPRSGGAVRKRPTVFGRLVLPLLLLIGMFGTIATSFAQTINIVHFNNSPTYLQGGGISLHINPQEVFPVQNKFVLQLMSEDGTTVINNNIGEVAEFFVPVINGQLPAGLPAGNYRLRVQAQNGAAVVATSANSTVFTVAGNTTFNRPTIGNPSGPILQIQCFTESNYFGSVNNSILSTTPANLSFQVTDYSSAFTYSITFVDHVTGTTNPLTLNVFGGVASFNMPGGRPAGYYTFEITKTNASGSTSYSYIYMFSTGNTSLGNLSSENVCVGIDVLFSNDRQVIFRNYPGSFYTVNYGDGSPIDTITHAQFIQDSIFSHAYSISTCQQAGALNIGGKYRAEILLFNKGIRVGTNNRCSEFIQNGNGTSKLVNTSLAPVAGMMGPPGACISSAVSILNQTLVGAYGESTVCETDPLVTWSLKRPNSSEFFPVPEAWYNNPAAHLNIPEGVLDQIGVWQVRLTAQNPQGCNTVSQVIADLCIEPQIIPAFTMNQKDTIFVCENTETNVGVNNTTDLQNLCATAVFRWRVYNDSGFLQVPGADYKILPHDSATNPNFTFIRPGKFRIELVVESYCISVPAIGIVTVQRTIRPGAVRLPANTGYCGADRIIDFQTDAAHRVSYNSNDGNEDYLWTITGGGFSFENGTTNTSRFPQIRFTDLATYNVAVHFKNVCGEADTFQVITFSEPVLVDAGIDRTICFTQDTIHVTGSGAPFGNALWSSVGTGGYAPSNTLNSIYTLTTADKNSGSVRLRLTVAPPQGSFCPSVTDSLLVSILPDNRGENRDAAFCSGYQLNYVPASSIPNSTFIWTSEVTSGTLNGVSSNGTGNVNDVLTLTSLTTPAVVVYTIIPIANNCEGIPFTYTVTINPIPTFTATSTLDSICSGSTTNIVFNSALAGVRYTWTSTVIDGTATGNTNATNQNGPIADVLLNNGATFTTVRYTISVVGPAPSSCPGSDTTIDVVIAPVTSQAIAGPDQLLCDPGQVQLNAVVPVTGAGSWSQTAGPAATITNPLSANTTATGLQPEQVYTFTWTVTSDNVNCPQTSDDVMVTVRPQTTQAFAGNDTSICITGNPSFSLNGNDRQSFEQGRWFIVSSSFSPAPALVSATNRNATLNNLQPGTVVMRWRITSDAPDCPATNDTMVITIGSVTPLADAGPNQLLCDVTAANLTAVAVGGNAIGTWSVIPPSTGAVVLPNDANSVVNNLIVGENRIEWAVSDAICPAINRDTVLITIRPPTTQAAVGNDTAICITGNASLPLNGTAAQPFERVRWTVVSSDFSPAPSFSNSTTPNTTLTGLRPGTVVLRYTITSEAEDCQPTFDDITITIGAATSLANAGPNQTLCDVLSTTLGATPVNGNSVGTWSVLNPSTGQVAQINSPISLVNTLAVGENKIVWTVADALCAAINTDTVNVFVRPPTTQANAGNDTLVCIVGNTTFRLGANLPLPNETGRWSIVNTTMAQAPSFSSFTNPAANLLGLSAGSVTLRWTITSDAPDCTPNTNDITIQVSPPTPEANAGSAQLLCNVTSTTLNATAVGNFSVGRWTVIEPSQVSIADATNPGTAISNLIIGTNRLVWTVTNQVCAGINTDTLVVTVRPATTISNAGLDTAFCTTGNPVYNLQANGVLAHEEGRWTVVSSTISPQPSLSSVSNPNAVLSGLRPGVITLRWTITSDAPDCQPSQSTVTIRVGPATPDANAGPNQLLCDATASTFNATAVGGTSIGTWSVVPPSGSVVAALNNPASSVSNLLVGTQQFVWTITDELCPQINRDSVLITVRPPTTEAFAGNDTAFCATGNTIFDMNANVPRSFEQGRWTVVSSSFAPAPSIANPLSPNTQISGLRAGTVVLRWTITSDAAGCAPTSDEITLTIGPATSEAFAGLDQLLCNVTSTTLNANPVSANSTGTWSVIAPSPATVVEASNALSLVNSLLVGDNILAWTVTDALCPQINSDTMIVTVRPPTTQAIAGRDTVFCTVGNNSYQLQANTVRSFETGRWTVEAGSTFTPTFSNIGAPNSTITNLVPGTLNLRWTITSDAQDCGPTSDMVTISIADVPAPAIAGVDQIVCNAFGATLSATPVPAFSIGTWSTIPPSGATISNPQNPATNVGNLVLGNNFFVWTVTSSVCGGINRDTVLIESFPAVTNMITGATTICEGQSTTITNQSISGGNGDYQYQWQQSTDNITFTNIAGGTDNNITVSPVQTTWYRRMATSLPCVTPSDTVQVIVLAKIDNNIISADQAICINTAPATIQGTIPTGGGEDFVYTWQQSTNNGTTWTTIDGAAGRDYTPGVLAANISYRRIVNTTLCDGLQRDTSNRVNIQINQDASAVLNPLITENCATWNITNATVNADLMPALNSDYQWYVNNQLVGTGPVFPGTTIALPGDSALIKMVAISRFGCLNDSTETWFYTTPDPVPGFVLSDTVVCGPTGVVVTNSTADISRFNFIWDFGQGQTSTAANPGTIIFPPNPTYMDTVYTVTLRATGGCDTITISQKIRVKATPRSVFTPSRTDGCSPLPVTFRNSSEGTNMQFEWIFGDGTPSLFSQDVTVSHIYTTNKLDTFYAKLVARNDCGADTSEYAIVVQPNAIVLDFAISGTDRIGCAPHTVEFFNNSTGGVLFTWDFGDGTTTTTQLNRDTVRHTYFTAGDYTVTLLASNGCSDTSDIERVSVRATPAVSFNASLNPICIGDTVRFVNTSEPGTYRWNLGDGTTSTNTNINRVYRNTGTYRVWLTGVREYPEGLACADSVFRDVIIVDTLATLMTVSDSVSSCVPFTVTFRNTVTDAVNVTWDFGDGTRATGDVVTHTYTRVGTYTAVMVATVGGGCNYKATQTIRANGPTGTLSYNPGFACFNEPVRFEIISGGAQQYIYYFGDGDSLVSNNPVVNHAYRTSGAFVPYVVLANGTCRLISQPGDTIKIDQVRAGFRFDFAQVCGSTTVTYIDTSRATYGIASVRWDLGDGTIATGNSASQVVTRTGNYRIVLRVNGTSGCIDSVVRNISIPVFTIPGINIKGNPILCEGGSNQLEADIVSADSIVAVLWDFGNGQQAEGVRVTANYVQTGTYTIRLTVRTVFGCTNTITRQVTVNPTPVVGASNDLSLCRGQSTILFATGADRYIWSPTQGLSCFDCASPVATPLTTTNYAVVGFNQFGCSSSDTVIVSVTQPFQITATQSDSLCIGSGMQLLATGAASYQWSPSFGLSATNIANPMARPTVSTTYRVVGYDAVNCFTDTAFVRIGVGPLPTLQLGSSALLVAGSRVNFTPAITGGPIRDYIWSPPTGLSCTDCPTPTATVNNDITYSLTIRNFYGCTATDTVSYRVFCQQDQIFIPNAFSPDGDGINDVLVVMGKGVSRVQHFRIFNRFGQLVFERSNFDANDPNAGWDGKIKGVPASPDVYVYTAEVLCTAGAVYSYKGNVTLFR